MFSTSNLDHFADRWRPHIVHYPDTSDDKRDNPRHLETESQRCHSQEYQYHAGYSQLKIILNIGTLCFIHTCDGSWVTISHNLFFFFHFPCFPVLHKQYNINLILTQCKKIPDHITHNEISFHLILLKPSETLWFWRDTGTTVFEIFALVIQLVSTIVMI